MKSKMTFAATSLLLAGALAVTYGCASSADDGGGGGGSGGGNSSSDSSSSGGSGGGGNGGGGSSATPSGDGFSFKGGQADGLFTGYGWVALGKDDSLTSPTCEGDKAITKAEPCNTSTQWKDSGDGKLCMTGLVPKLPADPKQEDYDNNWGVQIGVNATEPPAAAGDIMKDYKTVTFTFSGSPKSGLRAMLHREDDGDDVTYCVDSIKSGTAIPLTKFKTECWGGKSVDLIDADLPKIDKVGIQVSSTTQDKIDVDLCLEKVEFAK